jgi:hypothetical protein
MGYIARRRPINDEAKKTTRATTNRIFTIPAMAEATRPPKPSTARTMARTRISVDQRGTIVSLKIPGDAGTALDN